MMEIKERKPYNRLNISLASAQTDEVLDMDGDFIIVESLNGSCSIKLNERSNNPIDLAIFKTIRSPFDRLYITNTAQAGKSLILMIGGEASFETEEVPQSTKWWDGTTWQKWTGLENEAPYVSIKDRESEDTVVFDAVSLDAYGTLSHNGIDVSRLTKKIVMVSTTQNCTVYVQFSDDNANWYDLVDSTGSAFTWGVNNVKKAMTIDDYSHYMRVVIYNNAASASTITGVISGVC